MGVVGSLTFTASIGGVAIIALVATMAMNAIVAVAAILAIRAVTANTTIMGITAAYFKSPGTRGRPKTKSNRKRLPSAVCLSARFQRSLRLELYQLEEL